MDRPAPQQDLATLPPISVSVVVPVYQGEQTLTALTEEIARFVEEQSTPAGARFRVSELVLVHDAGPDDSERVMQELAARFPWVRPLWLSRNFGQHAATLAGLASSIGEWVFTMDEDGMHPPAAIPTFLDVALRENTSLVYARPTNAKRHGPFRDLTSNFAKWSFGALLGDRSLGTFSSFRLIDGETARSLAAFCGQGVYLDVALAWVVSSSAFCDVELKTDTRASGYAFGTLLRHFWRLVMSSGTRPLRFITFAGVSALVIAIVISVYAAYRKVSGGVPVEGWTSMIVALSGFSGLILFSLGIIAEYLGTTLMMAMGRPLYLLVSRPSRRRRR